MIELTKLTSEGLEIVSDILLDTAKIVASAFARYTAERASESATFNFDDFTMHLFDGHGSLIDSLTCKLPAEVTKHSSCHLGLEIVFFIPASAPDLSVCEAARTTVGTGIVVPIIRPKLDNYYTNNPYLKQFSRADNAGVMRSDYIYSSSNLQKTDHIAIGIYLDFLLPPTCIYYS